MTPTTYGRDFAYCLKSHGGVRGFNASLWRFLLRCTLFCHSVATFLTSVSSYEGGCGFEDKNELTNWGANWFYNVALFTNATDLDGNKYGPDPLKLLTAGPLRYEYKVPFIEIYDKEDTRLDATFFQYMFEGKTRGACWKKLMGHTDGGTHYYDSDVPVYRYADVLLMLAECENGLGAPDKCAAYINEVRKRAYGDKFEQHKYIAGDYADNEWAILQERDKEFVGEGSRWFDLLRLRDSNGKPFVFSVKAHYGSSLPILTEDKAYMMLWPVNVEVLNGDPEIKQTPGYE